MGKHIYESSYHQKTACPLQLVQVNSLSLSLSHTPETMTNQEPCYQSSFKSPVSLTITKVIKQSTTSELFWKNHRDHNMWTQLNSGILLHELWQHWTQQPQEQQTLARLAFKWTTGNYKHKRYTATQSLDTFKMGPSHEKLVRTGDAKVSLLSCSFWKFWPENT